MNRVRNVIWDWNGTLLDDVELCVRLANQLLDDHRLPTLTRDRYQEIFDFPVRLYWERAGLDLERTDFGAVSAWFCARFEDELHHAGLFASAAEALPAFARRGLRQFLLSGTEHETLLRMTARFGIHEHFEAVQGLSDTLAREKISAGRDLVARRRLDPEETLVIGDTLHDAEVADELGLRCALVATGHQSAERLAGAGCPVYEDLGALRDALLRA